MVRRKTYKTIFVVLLTILAMIAAVLSLSACGGDKNEPIPAGAEKGAYYCEVGGKEYLITLSDGPSVKVKFGDAEKEGTYALDETQLTMTFTESDTLTATYENEEITLTYEGKELTFIRKVNYTVTFETNGGSEVKAVSALNGKTVAKPDDPTRANYKFIGWRADEDSDALFDFENTVISGNITLYAKWEYIPQKNVIMLPNGNEVTVTEGENYTLGVPSDMESGYEFVGWVTDDGTLLTDNSGNSLSPWNIALGDVSVSAKIEVILTYELASDGSGYAVSGNEASAHLTQLTIPAYHDGEPVTEILTFDGYTALEKVNIPNTVTYFADISFPDSTKLAEYEIYNVDDVTNAAFTTKDGVVFSADEHTLVRYPIAKADESYTVPASVTEIASFAFYGLTEGDYRFPTYCGALTELVLPSNLKTIGEYAFYQRGNLKTVRFNNDKSNVEWSVGDYAFAGHLLKSFPFEKNLAEIGNYAFQSIDMLNKAPLHGELVLYDGIKTIGEYAFAGSTSMSSWMTSVTIPASLESLGAGTFSTCTTLTEVSFAEGCKLTSIPDEAFASSGIESIRLPDGITSIGASAFSECRELTEIEISSGVKSIGESAFYNCLSITRLTLPEGLESIGDMAFSGMSKLTEINIPSSATSVGSGIFSGCDALDLVNVTVGTGNTAIAIKDGVMYSADMKELLYYPANKTDTSYVMPDTVETIPSEVFAYNEYLTSVTLSKNLTVIPSGTFYRATNLREIVIPASVERIEAEAFYGCSALTSVKFENGSKLSTIGDSAFYSSGITAIELPNTLYMIGESAFSYSDLKSIVLPDSVTVLGSSCFRGCHELESATLPNRLTSIPDFTFTSCFSLQSFHISDAVESIGQDAFTNTASLSAFSIGENNKTFKVIEGNLYSKDGKTLLLYAHGSAATKFTVPDGVTYIAEYAFGFNYTYGTDGMPATALAFVDCNDVTEIGASAFQELTSLTGINLSNVTVIGANAFSKSGLKKVDLGNVESLGGSVFYQCSALKDVTLGTKLTSLPRMVFGQCTALESIDCSYVIEIGEYAFYYCTALKSITFSNGPVSLSDDAFMGSSLSMVIICGQESLDAFLADGSLFPYATTIKIKDTLSISDEKLSAIGFEKSNVDGGYIVYVKNSQKEQAEL